MIKQIMTLDELEKEAIKIQEYLEITISDNPEELVDRGNQLSVWMARTGKMLADAKVHQEIAYRKSIDEHIAKGLAPSILKEYAKSDCEEENYLVTLIDRQNRTCVHQIDWCRSSLSKIKEEIKYING